MIKDGSGKFIFYVGISKQMKAMMEGFGGLKDSVVKKKRVVETNLLRRSEKVVAIGEKNSKALSSKK